jgi:hypothetical protein
MEIHYVVVYQKNKFLFAIQILSFFNLPRIIVRRKKIPPYQIGMENAFFVNSMKGTKTPIIEQKVDL